MVIRGTKTKLASSAETELREKLSKTIFTIFAIIASLIIVLMFFAPKLGVFFGFFSIHRNEIDPTTLIKPNTPIFVNTPKATKNTTTNLSGYAQAGTTITLYLNGPESQKTTTGTDGLFSFSDVSLMSGTNTFFAKAKDTLGVESEASNTYTIVVDNDKPKITIDSPKNNENIKNLDKRVKITGKISERASLKINGKIGIIRPDNTFEFLMGLNEGANEIKVEATDDAGNTAEEKIKITYIKDS